MEVEYPSSADTSLEIPSIIEAISSSIDDSRFNFDELEQSTEENSTTTESDHMDIDANWSQPIPQQLDQYNQNYYQYNQQQQWNYQQGYSPYPQYGYMTPSPYNSYYMESPPVDYHHNYAYNTNMMTNYEQQQNQQQPYIFNGSQNLVVGPQDAEHSCNICIRTFKSASNLSRHFISKTHLKRLESKKQNSKVTIIRSKKPRVNGIGSSFTDISKDERAFLWQLDDEIFMFLKEYEEEKVKKDLALTTPPLSPNSRAIEDRKANIINNGTKNVANLIKSESIITITSSSENMQGSPLSVRSSSVDSVVKSSEMAETDNITSIIVEGSHFTSNDIESMRSSPGNVNAGVLTSNYSNSDNLTSKNENSSNITSHLKMTSPAYGYQHNSISSNLTSEFSNMTSISHEYGYIPDQFSKSNDNEAETTIKSEISTSMYKNGPNLTSNHSSQNQNNYYNSNNHATSQQSQENYGSIYQTVTSYSTTKPSTATQITSNIMNSGNPAATNSIASPRNTEMSTSDPSYNYQASNNVVMKEMNIKSEQIVNITSNSQNSPSLTTKNDNLSSITSNNQHSPNITSNNSPIIKINLNNVPATNITSNNVQAINKATNNMTNIKIEQNNTKFPSNYKIISTIPTSVNKMAANITSNSQNSLNQMSTSNKSSTNRIITINPSALTRASTNTATGYRITSMNPNITSNNGVPKNPTTYTLTSTNSNIRYINASNLIANNVKIQQISPNGIKNFRIVNNSHQALQNKVKIPHSSHNVQQSSATNGQSSPNYGPNSPSYAHNSPQAANQQQSNLQAVKNFTPSPSSHAEPLFSIPNSPSTPNSPTVLIQQETGEKYEIIFSDENFGENLS
ncbi:hypothetical protein ACKWTF_015537 [Chironomus riparius]